MIAHHVLNIHMNKPQADGERNGEAAGELDIDKMKRFIAYCKASV
jgi:DNA replication licensing factor MCM5